MGRDLSRRKFLTTSVSGLAAAGLAGPSLAREIVYGPPAPRRELEIRTLGRTGIALPLVNMGSGANMDEGLAQACFETGMRLFDTDARYRNGRHEQLLGRVVSRLGVRDQVIIVTKVHPPELRRGLSPRESQRLLRSAVEGCLRRLKTDYIDILMVHDVADRRTALDPDIIEAMSRVREQGKTRFLGTATHTSMAVAIKASVEAEIYDVVLTSINFTMADDAALMRAIEHAAQKGVGIIAMKTQAGGYAFPNPETHKEFRGAVINSAALKWVCHNKHIATTIPGIDNYEQLRANWAVALNPGYTDEERRFLANNEIKLGFEFCRQCRFCMATCPHGVDVPALMRTHMYAKQYADVARARETLDLIPAGRGLAVCGSCTSCAVACSHSVNVPRKLEELKLLYA
jgi:predicted aldo/keto reductase-like oxidoreductase